MKKLFFLSLFLIITHILHCSAQQAKQAKQFVRLGKATPQATTREQILADPRIFIDKPDCEIIGFTFGMFPKGHDFIGPFKVKGAELTPEIIKLLQDLEDPQGSVFIENITAKCDGMTRTLTSIAFTMAINKK